MSLIKIPPILAAAACNYITWTPPNPPAPKEQHMKLTTSEVFMRNIIRQANFAAKFLSTVAFLAEGAVIYAENYPSSRLSKDILSLLIFEGVSSANASRNIRVTRWFIAGSALTTIAGLIRLSCYRTLGRLFTYELSIMNDHKLVTTGLYGFVRHPSYLGGLLSIVGLTMCHMTRGSWLVESGAMRTWIGGSLVGLWHLWSWYLGSQSGNRARKEDENLHKEFGQQWVEWQKRVPYRIFPGIF